MTDSRKVSIQTITLAERPAAQSFYQSVGYPHAIQPSDIVVTATLRAKVIGVVRLAHEFGFTILRGMQVLQEHQRSGIGTLMIKELEKHIGDDCYCLPHGWLEGFYGQIGFVKALDRQAPVHLQERLINIRKKYPQLIVMKRSSSDVF